MCSKQWVVLYNPFTGILMTQDSRAGFCVGSISTERDWEEILSTCMFIVCWWLFKTKCQTLLDITFFPEIQQRGIIYELSVTAK